MASWFYFLRCLPPGFFFLIPLLPPPRWDPQNLTPGLLECLPQWSPDLPLTTCQCTLFLLRQLSLNHIPNHKTSPAHKTLLFSLPKTCSANALGPSYSTAHLDLVLFLTQFCYCTPHSRYSNFPICTFWAHLFNASELFIPPSECFFLLHVSRNPPPATCQGAHSSNCHQSYGGLITTPIAHLALAHHLIQQKLWILTEHTAS